MQILFKLNKIEVPQFALIDEKASFESIKPYCEVSIVVEIPIILIGLKISYGDEKTVLAQIVVNNYFEIDKDSWKGFEKDGKIIIPKGFLQHLSSVAFGVARGALFTKTENSCRITLPLVDANQVIKDSLVIEPKEQG